MTTLTDQDVAFWSVVAQVIPVAALALALEARLLAKRLSKKAARSARRYRQAWAAWLLITWLSLSSVLFSALQRLAGDPLSPDAVETSSSDVGTIIAILAIVNAFLMVAYLPIARVVSATATPRGTVDPFAYRWSKGNRLIRTLEREIAGFAPDYAENRAGRLDLLMRSANLLVLLGPVEDDLAFAEKRLAAGGFTPTQSKELREAIDRSRALVEEGRENAMQLLEAHADQKLSYGRLEKIERGMRKQLKSLRKMKRTSAKDSDKYVRRYLAQSASN